MKKNTFVAAISLLGCLLLFSEQHTDLTRQLKKYSKIINIIKEFYPEKIDQKKMVFSSINGLLKGLDPHSYFLDPLSLRSMNEDQRGNYFGIGIRITKYEDRLTVVTPLKGTPAYKLGILSGDVITEIDGESTKNFSTTKAMKKLRGAKGTFVEIKIKRENLKKLLHYTIKREEIPLKSISYSLIHPLNPRVGYINIRTFGNTTAKELTENIETLIKKKGINALILDLRGNSGGSLYAAIDISDLFLEKGKTIVSIKGRRIQQTFKAQKKNQYPNLSLAILINRSSASASEIVAAAMQYHKKATIIGSRSWGKGLVETLFKLPLNSAVALTTAKYYTPDNRCIQRDYSQLDTYYSTISSSEYDTDKTISGGVFPDIFVKSKTYPPLIIQFISKGTFFKFSRKILKKNLNISQDFTANRRIIKKFRQYLDKEKIAYNEKEFNKHLLDIQIEIEREVIENKFSDNEGTKVFLSYDPVSKKAIDILNSTGR